MKTERRPAQHPGQNRYPNSRIAASAMPAGGQTREMVPERNDVSLPSSPPRKYSAMSNTTRVKVVRFVFGRDTVMTGFESIADSSECNGSLQASPLVQTRRSLSYPDASTRFIRDPGWPVRGGTERKSTQKRLPSPGEEMTPQEPPIRCTARWTIARPMPVPSYF